MKKGGKAHKTADYSKFAKDIQSREGSAQRLAQIGGVREGLSQHFLRDKHHC